MARSAHAYTVSTPHGPRSVRLSLDAAQYSQRIMMEYLSAGRLYEQETCAFFGAVLKDGDAFLDIGAHVGWFSMLAAALVGPSGEVWSFEPNRQNHAHLLDHIALNEAWHVRPMHMAVGETSGILPLRVSTDNDGGHALVPVSDADDRARALAEEQVQPVYVCSLDSLFADRSFTSLKAIKMDAEGAEHAIMLGAREFLKRHQVPFVIAEMNQSCLELMGSSEHDFRAFMTSLGYETNFFHPTRPELVPLPPGETVNSDVLLNYCFRLPGAALG